MNPADDCTAPRAVLYTGNREEIVVTLTTLPPPPELSVARGQKLLVEDAPKEYVSHGRPPDRRFKLLPWLRSKNHRWWRVYNEGRSRTPEDGFVYLEVTNEVAD